MKKMMVILRTFVLIGVVLLITGCPKEEGKSGKSARSARRDSSYRSNSELESILARTRIPPREPLLYLPVKAGTIMTYRIEIGEEEPLGYREILWPRGNSRIRMGTRSRFIGYIKNKDKNDFCLKMRIKGFAEKQGGLQYPIGVELEILEDELGVFDNAKQVFWAATLSGTFTVHEVVTFSPYTPGAPSGSYGSYSSDEGFSMNILYFGEKPGISIGLGDSPIDTLTYIGEETVPGTGHTGLIFLRLVESQDKKQFGEHDVSPLSKTFTEEKWFEMGKGLTRLEQEVEGRRSMTWVLESFTEGPEI